MDLMTPQLAAVVYMMFSTHITRTKIIAGVVVAVVLVAAVGFWMVRRRRARV